MLENIDGLLVHGLDADRDTDTAIQTSTILKILSYHGFLLHRRSHPQRAVWPQHNPYYQRCQPLYENYLLPSII